MAVSYVGGAGSGGTTSGAGSSVTCPTVLDGDLGVAVFGHSSGTVTPPAGWTLLASLTAGSLLSKVYTKFMDDTDSGDTMTWAHDGSLQRNSVVVGIWRGTTGAGVVQTRAESTTTVTHLAPTATSPTGGCIPITAVMERSSTPSTSFTPPSGYASRVTAFGTGTGAITAALADDISPEITAGVSIGGGNWVGDVANGNVATFTIGLVPSTSTPIGGTFTIAPASGTAPLGVTGTVAATGGTGSPFEYTYHWGDGTTTGPTSSATASHTYGGAAAYTAALNNRAYVDVENT